MSPLAQYNHWSNKVFHEQNLIFQILLTPIIYMVTVISTDLKNK